MNAAQTAPTPSAVEPRTSPPAAAASQQAARPAVRSSAYNLAIGYLRAFVTVMVVAHHAVLAYVGFAPAIPATLTAKPRIWQAFPVVDSHQWPAFGLFTGYNDTFFMSLMFFVSGLFVWKSLERKGAGHFLRDRALRLGIPFVVAAALLGPLAYFPTYLQTGARGLAGFWRQWFALGSWPSGPVWFIWVLLAFDCVAAALFGLVPSFGRALGGFLSDLGKRPVAFFALLVAVSAAAYTPLELIFNGFSWTELGPFVFQTSRILHYLAYFLIAAALGALGTEGGLFAREGKLARRWPLWAVASLVAFAIATVLFFAALGHPESPNLWGTIGGFGFAFCCAAASFAFLAVFLRFVKQSRPAFDSLRDNAYGIYLLHYAFVSWLQFALLGANVPGFLKGVLVTAGAVLLSWGATAALRRIPAVGRVL